jgi:hypothetical protein
MSIEAYDRFTSRASKIWTSFLYPLPFSSAQDAERLILFGFYANTYVNHKNYLYDIETDALANLLSDYNSKISGLTTEEVIVVNSVVAKKYIADIERQIHDQEILTKLAKKDAEAAEIESKITALSADRLALTTLETKLNTEIAISEAKIEEITSKIALEVANLTLTEIEKSEKEIALEEEKLKILRVANDVAKIQLGIVEAGLELVDIDLKVSKATSDIERVKADIAKTQIYQAELETAMARKDATEAEFAIYVSELASVTALNIELTAKETYLTGLTADEESHTQDMLDLLNARYDNREAELDRQKAVNDINDDHKRDLLDLDVKGATNENSVRGFNVLAQQKVNDSQEIAASKAKTAAVAAATTIAKANIANTLVHTIAKAPTSE